MSETVLTNAKLVLGDEVIDGSLLVRDGIIAEIGAPTATGEDMGGDYILPGFVELHTDALEGHYKPRPRVRWNPRWRPVLIDSWTKPSISSVSNRPSRR